MQAYIVHSANQSQVAWVYQFGDLVSQMGYSPEYWYAHQGQQYAFDMVEKSTLVLGLAVSMQNLNMVLQMYQYAKQRGKKAILVVEKGIRLPGSYARDPNVTVFRKNMPQNPVRFVQMKISSGR